MDDLFNCMSEWTSEKWLEVIRRESSLGCLSRCLEEWSGRKKNKLKHSISHGRSVGLCRCLNFWSLLVFHVESVTHPLDLSHQVKRRCHHTAKSSESHSLPTVSQLLKAVPSCISLSRRQVFSKLWASFSNLRNATSSSSGATLTIPYPQRVLPLTHPRS